MAQGRGRGGRGRGSARRTTGAGSRGSSGAPRGAQSRPRRQAGISGRSREDGPEAASGQRSTGPGSASSRGAAARGAPARGTGGRAAQARGGSARAAPPRTGSSRGASPKGAASRTSTARGSETRTARSSRGAARGSAGGRGQGRGQSASPGTPRTRQAAPGTARSSRASSTQSGRPGGRGPHSDRLRRTGARRPRVPRPRYGLRRTLVAGLAVLLVVGMGVGAVAGAMWVRETIRTQDADRAAAQTHTVYPEPEACRSGDLSIESSGPETVGAGQGASFTLSVTNSGPVSCLLDAGAASVGVELTSGENPVWSSTACPVGDAERPLLLGQGDSTQITLEWNGYTVGSYCDLAQEPAAGPAAQASGTGTEPATDSATGTPSQGPGQEGGDERVAGPGTYRYRFTLGGQDVTEPTLFVVE